MVSADIFADGYSAVSITAGNPLDQSLREQLAVQFSREGWIKLQGVLTAADVNALASTIMQKWEDPRILHDDEDDHIRGVGLMRMFEYSQAFRDLIAREPVVGLVEAILGESCHVIAQNALRIAPQQGIVNWHIDDELLFPCPPTKHRHAAHSAMPCFSVNVIYALTATDTVKRGPTQVVPRSHYSGRHAPKDPVDFDGHDPTCIFANPGDVYIMNSQLWHRGMRNGSQTIRLSASIIYGRRFVAQRFYPFLNYRFPHHVLNGASERLLRLLGKHPKGPYG